MKDVRPNLAHWVLTKGRFRHRRLEQFRRIFSVQRDSTILDVGGGEHIWLESGLERQVTILNLLPPDNPNPHFNYVTGDACNMSMFGDQSYDVVFSNSVIEHVGDFSDQRKMAREVCRVGRGYWVQTPYRHFPIEVHFLFPLFQYMPKNIQYAIAHKWPFSFAKSFKLDVQYEVDNIWLLGIDALQDLFPEAQIHKERFLGLVKSIIAVRKPRM